MYTDQTLVFSTGQAITAAAWSNDVVELKAISDIGEGRSLYVNTSVTKDFTAGGGGATALTIQVVVGTAANMGGTNQVVGSSDSIPIAALKDATGQKQGYTSVVRINPIVSGLTAALASQGNTGAKYMAIRYVPTGGDGTFTDGEVSSQLVLNIQDGRKAYTSGFTVV